MGKEQKIKTLWKSIFQDTDEFIRFYFDRKYRDENALLYESGDLSVAALLLLPYPMNWGGHTWQTSYISGACTHPEFRNQGLMTRLLQEAFRRMYQRGIALTTLIPAEEWLFHYYGKSGYAPVFKYSTETDIPLSSHTVDIEVIAPEKFQPEFTAEVYPYFQRQTEARPSAILHPIDDYIAITEEVYLSGGRLLVAYDPASGTPSGWAVAVPGEKEVLVKEILWDNETVKAALLQKISQLWNTSAISCRIPPVDGRTYPYGMARIIHAQRLLEQWARLYPSLSCTLALSDPQLPANTATYTLTNGQCLRNNSLFPEKLIQTDIMTLTQALLGSPSGLFPALWKQEAICLHPYMNLMLD